MPTEQAKARVQAARAAFALQVAALASCRLIFLDESGCHISMTRTYGRSRSGERIRCLVPRNRGTVLTMIGALGPEGIVALSTHVGATTGDIFEEYVRTKLVPVLRRGDVVVWDNLGAHHRRTTIERIEAVGARVLFLPAYSPDMNPIELCWSKVKSILRFLEARTVGTLVEAIHDACAAVRPAEACGWIRHCLGQIN